MSEARLDLTGNADVAQREIDKLTKGMAKLREQVRQVNQDAVKGAKESTTALNSWAAGLANLKAQTDKFAAGMRELKRQQQEMQKAALSFDTAMRGSSAFETGLPHAPGFQRGFRPTGGRFDEVAREMRTLTKDQTNAGISTTAFTGSLMRMAGGLAITAMAVRTVRDTWASYRAELDATAAKQGEFQQRFAKDIAISRDSRFGKEIERELSNVPGVKKEDARAAFFGVTHEAPTMERGRRLEIAKGISRLAPTGADMTALGTTAAQIGEVLPKETAANVADIAALMHREAGGDIERLGNEKFQRAMRQLVESGAMTPDEALATGLAAAQGKFSAGSLAKMAEVASATKESLRPSPGEIGKIPAAKRRLANLGARERLALMRSDKYAAEAGLGEAGALELSRLTPESLADNVAMISATRREDTIGQITSGMMQTQAGRQALTGYAAQSTAEKNAALTAATTLETKNLNDQIKALVAGKGPAAGLVGQFATGVTGFYNALGLSPVASSPNIDKELVQQTTLLREMKGVMQTKQHIAVDNHTESHGASGSW